MADNQQTRILPNTPAMETYLGVGYDGMTVAQAKEIIEARKKDAASFPFTEQKRAEAFLAAYRGQPVAIAKRRGSTLPKPEEEMEAV